MTQKTAATGAPATPAGAGPTRALLLGGVVAGPLYILVTLAQAVTRDGFDLTRHAASLLSNGDLGWIQTTNLAVAGLLSVGCAAGMRRAMPAGRGRTWGPLLVGVYGAGLVGAAIFRADPADGFPPGTPAGAPETVSGAGLGHLVAGGIGFLALIAACVVFARRFASLGQRGLAVYSALTGVAFFAGFAGFAGVASGAGNRALNVAFGVAVVLGWTWISVMAARLRNPSGQPG